MSFFINKIKIAIVGIGNCASSLIQGIEYYKTRDNKDIIGLMHGTIGDYKPSDIEIVAAFASDYVPWQKNNKICL